MVGKRITTGAAMGSGYVPGQPIILQVSLLLLMTGILRAEPQVLAGHNDSTPTTAPSTTSGPDQGLVVAAYDPEASITGLYTGPYFDPLTPRNMTAHLGDEAKLPCTVRQLGDKSVSWVRVRDADILTVDRYTFVGDERFESHYSTATETWNLVIKYVQERDAGEYECQVSTEPKMSQLFSLRVVIPKVMIAPVGDRYVKAGSTVRVDCQITDVVQLPDYIFWYHADKRVMDRHDPNLLVTVKRTDVEAILSTLTIHKVRQEQSGNYTCMPSNLHAASVTLHVLNEKHPAAMQDERSSACSAEAKLPLTLALLVCVLVWSMSVGSEGDNSSSTTEVDDPNTAPALATSPSLTHPIASPPSFPSPSLPSVFPLAVMSDQEHQKVIEMLWDLLKIDALPQAQEGNGYVQDMDQLTRASQMVGTRTWGARVLRQLNQAQVALDMESLPSSYLMKPREARVQVLEEAVGLPNVSKEEGEQVTDDSSPNEHRTCLASFATAHQQMQLVSSVAQVKSCRSIGRVLMARQR